MIKSYPHSALHATKMQEEPVPVSKTVPKGLDVAQLVTLALSSCPAPVVARRLGVSVDLVYGWGYGRSLPTMGHIIQAPRSFSRRLLVLSLERISIADLAHADPHEAVGELLCYLGALLVVTRRPLEELTDQELTKAIEDARHAETEGARVARTLEAERLRRQGAKGAGK